MSVRHILAAVSTAALLASSTTGVFADSMASSASGVGVVSHADQTSGSSVVLGAGSTQQAQSGPEGGAAAGSSAGGGGSAGTFKLKLKLGETYGGGVSISFAKAGGGASGYAWAVGGEKPSEPGKPGEETGFGPGGASPLACVVKISDWVRWYKLDVKVRRVVFNCECPTKPKYVQLNPICPKDPADIFVASRQ